MHFVCKNWLRCYGVLSIQSTGRWRKKTSSKSILHITRVISTWAESRVFDVSGLPVGIIEDESVLSKPWWAGRAHR